MHSTFVELLDQQETFIYLTKLSNEYNQRQISSSTLHVYVTIDDSIPPFQHEATSHCIRSTRLLDTSCAWSPRITKMKESLLQNNCFS